MKKAKQTLSLILSVIMLVGVFCIIPANAELTDEDVITIFHTNDMHASVENLSYVAAIKAATENSLLVDAGDAVQGSALATYTSGDAIVKLMNAAGYDLGTLGNHEFDYGSEALLANAKNANFPLISANTYDKDGKLLLDGINEGNGKTWTTVVNDHKLGFFGLTTVETATKTNPQNLNGINFKDEIATAKAMVEELRSEDCDVIIALAHVGIDLASDPTTHKIAEEVDGIDVIIDGHSHSEEDTEIDGTYICQTGTKLANLGEITFTFDEEGAFEVESKLTALSEDYLATVTADEEVAALYTSLSDELAPILNEKVAYSNTHIYYSASDSLRTSRIEQTPCSTLVADSMKWQGEEMLKALNVNYPVIALQNGGGVRADLPKGDITKGDILNVLPFSNTIQIVEITPAQLYTAIENGVSKIGLTEDGYLNLETLNGAYCQVAGMHIVIDTAAEKRVTEISLPHDDGTKEVLKADDTTTKLALVSNDFELAGGDGYSVLGECKKITEGGPLDMALQDFIKHISDENGKFTWAKADTRVFVKGVMEKQNKEFTNIKVNVALEPNKFYDVELDGTTKFSALSDEKGFITLYSVTPGYHTVYLSALEGKKLETSDTDSDGNKISVEVNPYLYVSTFTGINVDSYEAKDKSVNGDVNNDCTLSLLDVVAIQRFKAELYDSVLALQYADFNNDAKITLEDVTAIQRNLAGLKD